MLSADTLIETIEELDFSYVQPCEHSQHSVRHPSNQPAMFYIRSACSYCNRQTEYFICLEGWEWARAARIHCRDCHIIMKRDECWTILYTIGSDDRTNRR